MFASAVALLMNRIIRAPFSSPAPIDWARVSMMIRPGATLAPSTAAMSSARSPRSVPRFGEAEMRKNGTFFWQAFGVGQFEADLPLSQSGRALGGDIDSGRLLDAAGRPFPTERDVHRQMGHDEAFEGLRGAIEGDESLPRQDVLDEPFLLRGELDGFERLEDKFRTSGRFMLP
jgi:hypothetical protein